MSKSQATKNKILKVAGNLFNTQGYKATSLSDITLASGFTKGAIYSYFPNKEQLEREALIYMTELIVNQLGSAIANEKSVLDKMDAVFHFYARYYSNPPVHGGCPILNAAVEVDDTHAGMKEIIRRTLDLLHDSLVHVLRNGIKFKQLREELDVEEFSHVVISSLEGAVMMSKINGNTQAIRRTIKFLQQQLYSYSLN